MCTAQLAAKHAGDGWSCIAQVLGRPESFFLNEAALTVCRFGLPAFNSPVRSGSRGPSPGRWRYSARGISRALHAPDRVAPLNEPDLSPYPAVTLRVGLGELEASYGVGGLRRW
ncbi:MAG: hypothetical protein ACE5JI_15805 [Acidobacteriota bacterium]